MQGRSRVGALRFAMSWRSKPIGMGTFPIQALARTGVGARRGPSPICGRPPPRKVFLQCFDQIACVHMSGLLVRSHMNAGQDGFRGTSSKQKCDLVVGPLRVSECLVSWID